MRRWIVKCLMLMAVASVATVASADLPPPPGELATEGIQKSLQSPVFISFWLLWGGLVVVPLALFFMRSFARVVMGGVGILMLIMGLVMGAKNYDCCGKCGAKLERWYDRGRHVACPRCNPEVKHRHLPEHIRMAADEQPSDLPGAVKFGKAQKHEPPE